MHDRVANATSYRDQTDVFFEAPALYLRERFPSAVDPTFPPSPFPSSDPRSLAATEHAWKHEWPRYLVLFGALLEERGVRDVMGEKGYREVWRRGRDWEGEGKRKGGVRVWRAVD